MLARSRCALLVVALASVGGFMACGGPARRPAVPWAEGGAASAKALASAKATPWIRMTPQGTSMCVRLDDGSFHRVVYGVGGGGFDFRPSVPVPVTRDIDCSDYGVTTLGDKGVLGSFDEHGVRPSGAYPTARALHVGPGWICFVSAEGTVSCADGRSPPFDMNALGPVAEIIGDGCARYRDGKVACRASGAPPDVYWTDARQASIEGGVACAVLASGQVSCRGDNRFGQRGFAGAVDGAVATLVPGLDHVDEVHTSGTHVCARRGGEVWCWGQANGGQGGEAAGRVSVAWPRCEVDEAATERDKREVERGQAICRGPRPPGDDPFCRGMSGAYASTVYKGNPGWDCDPAGVTRFAPPTRVDDISDAIALATRGSMTCALRVGRVLTCWGNGAWERKELVIPPAELPVERVVAPAPPRGPSVQVNEWGVLVHAASGGLTFHPWRDGPLGAGQPLTGVVDAVLAPGVCTLTAAGAVACEAAFDSPARTATAPAGFDRFAGRGHDCFASRDGVISCLQGNGPWGAKLSAAGDIVEAGGNCGRYADGAVRCFVGGPIAPPELVTVLGDVVSLSAPLWPLTMCAVKRDGSVWCVGGTFDLRVSPPPTPVAIAGAPPATAVAATYGHACLLAVDATVWCWGRATEGQAGEVAHARAVVTPSCAVDRAATAEARARMTAARPECRAKAAPDDCKPTEYVWKDGCEPPGPLGTTRLQPTPVAVPGVADAIAIGAGTGRSCALTRAGALTCWGDGSSALQTVATTVD